LVALSLCALSPFDRVTGFDETADAGTVVAVSTETILVLPDRDGASTIALSESTLRVTLLPAPMPLTLHDLPPMS